MVAAMIACALCGAKWGSSWGGFVLEKESGGLVRGCADLWRGLPRNTRRGMKGDKEGKRKGEG